MTANLYWLGVSLALLAGSTTQFGSVLQKKVVNDVSAEPEFMRNLVKKPIWILGVIMSFGVSSIFYLAAQIFIGPALIPGLMAFGLVILALGSVKIVGEKLKIEEIFGILLMIIGTFLLSMSELSIDIIESNLLEIGFIARTTIFTLIIAILSFVCHLLQKKYEKLRGILFAILSGFMFALSNLWVSQFMGVVADVFSGVFSIAQLIIFIISAIILILANIIGLATIQHAYRVGQASNMIPIQHVPVLIAPVCIYFLVFLLVPPSFISILYLVSSIVLIMTSAFLLGRRLAQMEEIK